MVALPSRPPYSRGRDLGAERTILLRIIRGRAVRPQESPATTSQYALHGQCLRSLRMRTPRREIVEEKINPRAASRRRDSAFIFPERHTAARTPFCRMSAMDVLLLALLALDGQGRIYCRAGGFWNNPGQSTSRRQHVQVDWASKFPIAPFPVVPRGHKPGQARLSGFSARHKCTVNRVAKTATFQDWEDDKDRACPSQSGDTLSGFRRDHL